jgi:hypothetical protein
VGAGCGVLAGYYFGAGLMLKPSVVQQVTQAITQLAGGVHSAVTGVVLNDSKWRFLSCELVETFMR